MKIETKFNITDKVFLISNNKIVQYHIVGIRVTIEYIGVQLQDKTTTLYYLSDRTLNPVSENQLYLTKEELIKSL